MLEHTEITRNCRIRRRHKNNTEVQFMLLQANSFTCKLLIDVLREMGLFTLLNCCFSWLLFSLKLKLDSQSRLTVPELSGYHCMFVYCYMLWKKTSFIDFYVFKNSYFTN